MAGKARRRLWHLIGGSLFPILAFFVSEQTLLIALSAVTFAFLIMESVRLLSSRANELFFRYFHGMLKEEERRRPTGSSYLLVASLLAFLLFDRDVAITCLFFLAVGDPMAATFGERLGSRRALGWGWHAWGWGGGLACFLSCLAIGMVLTQIGLDISPFLIVGGSAAAALITLLPWPIDDNLIIPLFSGGVMTLIIACG
jgi:dolichol kinase